MGRHVRCEKNLQVCGPLPLFLFLSLGRMLLAQDLPSRLETAMTLAPDADTRNTYALAVLRIAVGVFFLIFGQYKVFGTEFTLHGGFQFWINKFLEGGAYPFMVPVLRGFVWPAATVLAFLTAYGELAIGIGLVLGVLVRPASVGGLLLMIALFFSSDYPGAHAAFWQYFGASLSHSVFALCFVTFLAGRADAVWSVKTARKKWNIASSRTDI
jgi:thiosulfate dehydrogenase [quinone] large subunit